MEKFVWAYVTGLKIPEEGILGGRGVLAFLHSSRITVLTVIGKTAAIRRQLDHLSFMLPSIKTWRGSTQTRRSYRDRRTEKYLSTLQLAHDNLSAIHTKLQEKHDEWVVMVQDLQSAEEQDLYDASCDEIMSLLLESEDRMIELRRRRSDGQADLYRQGQQFSNVANDSLASHTAFVAAHPTSSIPTHRGHSSGFAFKAPKINLPTFSGNYMEFKQFWVIFEANIHRRTDLSNIEKLTHLISQLEGDARHSVRGILVNDSNYEVAAALLESRFDRADERLVTILYSEFMRISASSRKVEDKQRILDCAVFAAVRICWRGP